MRLAASSETLSGDKMPLLATPRPSGSVNSIADHCVAGTGGQIARWAISLDALLADALGRRAFSYHLKKEHSEENLQFWVDCEAYKNTAGEGERQRIALKMVKKYIGDTAEIPVNLPHKLENCVKTCRLWHYDSFRLQQNHIYDLMRRDSYPRFVKSEQYRRLMQLGKLKWSLAVNKMHSRADA